MRVAFLYNRACEDPAKAGDDNVPSRSPVVAAIRRLGHRVIPIACTLNLTRIRRRLEHAQPDVVFNRVESLGGSDAMMPAITLLLDTMQIPYTGCSTEAMVAAANKITVKEQLVHAGLPTPDWITPDFGFRISDFGLKEEHKNPQSLVPSGRRFPKYIIKSVLEHASFEMNDEAIIGAATRAEIIEVIRDRIAQTGRPFFAERFIEGREFNLSLLGDGPRVLPPAEIDFSAFPAGKARIVGQRAKWDAGAFEFHNTPRRYDFPPADTSLIERLSSLAIKCWRQFRLGGYARVDFRVDEDGQPWILEINTNPCIAPTSGFAAALEEAGISYDNGIQLILDGALARDSGDRRAREGIDGKPNSNLARPLSPLHNG